MNNINPIVAICGICCLWPLLVGALPVYLFMRYRPGFRSPIVIRSSDDIRPRGPRYN